MQRYNILWADDEIELLKPHILFLNGKGYDITPVTSGADAIEECQNTFYDVIFLDENMPGMTGLETLAHIADIQPNVPVVMITKSEEEHIMEEAIASKISDYLIKPLNPSQILLSVKKLLENKRLVTERTNMSYQQDFRNISMALMEKMDHQEWVNIYKKLVYWDLEMDNTGSHDMAEVLGMQINEANMNFARFIRNQYESWLNVPGADRPVMSHELMRKKIFPELRSGDPLFFILIDNLRYDQWRVIQKTISDHFNLDREELYYAILPTTTAYARNAIFSGMLPLDMDKYHPDIWRNEDEEEGKNNFEDEFLKRQLAKLRIDIRWSYNKIKNLSQGRNLADNIHNMTKNDLNVIVYNFVDMLSHARTEMEVIRELAPDEKAYRSLSLSWFHHSPLLDIFRKIGERGGRIILSTDHGTIRVKKPFKIVGDRNTNTNLRFKLGKNLSFEENKVFVVRKPESIFLPKLNVSSTYVFAVEDYFFAYPNNYNHYVKYYSDTFQHGGLSLEEMIIPIISLTSKNR